jgi:hypothetical protein
VSPVVDFLMGLSGPFPKADLPRERASRMAAVKHGLVLGEAYPANIS